MGLTKDRIRVTISGAGGSVEIYSVVGLSIKVQKESIYVGLPGNHSSLEQLAYAMSLGSGAVVLTIVEELSVDESGNPFTSASQLLGMVMQRVITTGTAMSGLNTKVTVTISADSGGSYSFTGIFDSIDVQMLDTLSAKVTYTIKIGDG